MIGWVTPRKSCIETVPRGEVMRALGVGRAVASRFPGLSLGDYAFGFTGMRSEVTIGGRLLRPIDPKLGSIESFPATMQMLFAGQNRGNLLFRV